jgi:hypothetical protein
LKFPWTLPSLPGLLLFSGKYEETFQKQIKTVEGRRDNGWRAQELPSKRSLVLQDVAQNKPDFRSTLAAGQTLKQG